MIERNEYLQMLKDWKDKDLIKVVTGIRRCGKSTLFELFIEYLKQIGVKEDHIISLNLESPEYHFNDYMELYHYVNEKIAVFRTDSILTKRILTKNKECKML